MKATLIVHHKQARIRLDFPYDINVIDEVKKIGARWSASLKCWHIADTEEARARFSLPDKVITSRLVVETKKQVQNTALLYISEPNRNALLQLQNMVLLKGYSHHTLHTYKSEFGQLLYVLGNFRVDDLTEVQIKSYLLYCVQKLKLGESQLNQRINAIKFYFEVVLKKPRMLFDLPRPKKPLLLPHVLDTSDVSGILHHATNLKHKALLMVAYGGGLRVSEVVKLKLTDIDSKRMQIRVECGKGKKDRVVMLSEKLLFTLREYAKMYKPTYYLFESKDSKTNYSIRSAQAVFKQALQRANINKPVGIHSMHHSFATHLLETGTDVRVIQELLGHDQISTTMRYTHVSKRSINQVQSPLDKL